MKIKVKELQDICKVILSAVDGSNSSSIVNETLELKTADNKLLLSVTNRDYYVTVKMDIDTNEDLFAVVDAKLFLSLISKISSQEVELSVNDKCLSITANGKYNIPQVYNDEGNLVALPKIEIDNKTVEFEIKPEILNSIATYNTKELLINKNSLSYNKNIYYIDELGAITYNFYRACINNFTLDKPVKMILNNKLVKLFGLFKHDVVKFSLGYDLDVNNEIKTKICLDSGNIILTSILLNDEKLLASLPAAALRDRSNNMYKYSINISKDDLSQTINRLMIFNNKADDKNFGKFVFDKDKFTIYDSTLTSYETISYVNTVLNNLDEPYETILNLIDIKTIIETCADKYLVLNFGDNKAVMVSRGNIKNLIPEAPVNG